MQGLHYIANRAFAMDDISNWEGRSNYEILKNIFIDTTHLDLFGPRSCRVAFIGNRAVPGMTFSYWGGGTIEL